MADNDGTYVGLDIGGTRFRAAAAHEQGAILRKVQAPAPYEVADGLALLDEMIGDVAGNVDIEAIGAAIGGPMDWRTGVINALHQPAWRDVPLKARMEEKWCVPFFVDVDTNVAALGEYRSMEKKADRLLYITMSTGMGGGFLIDGQIYRGAGGDHPEIAHQSIRYQCANPAGISCECGLPDCLEALISGNGIRRVYGKPAELLDEDEWAEVAYNLGQGLRNIAAILLPGLIILGGGVALGGGEKLVERARKVMNDHLRILPTPELRLSSLGEDTPLIGALALVQQSAGFG
jgi:predicted NBD/HSP70 family sugar kinase